MKVPKVEDRVCVDGWVGGWVGVGVGVGVGVCVCEIFHLTYRFLFPAE